MSCQGRDFAAFSKKYIFLLEKKIDSIFTFVESISAFRQSLLKWNQVCINKEYLKRMSRKRRYEHRKFKTINLLVFLKENKH